MRWLAERMRENGLRSASTRQDIAVPAEFSRRVVCCCCCSVLNSTAVATTHGSFNLTANTDCLRQRTMKQPGVKIVKTSASCVDCGTDSGPEGHRTTRLVWVSTSEHHCTGISEAHPSTNHLQPRTVCTRNRFRQP